MKLLSELDSSALPKTVSMTDLITLSQGTYIDEKSNIVILGNSGTGKTHASIGLAIAACCQGRRVRFYTTTELTSELEAAQEAHQLHRYLRRFANGHFQVSEVFGSPGQWGALDRR